MGIRVLGGEHRSRVLKTLKGDDTRPTRSLVREASFNLLKGLYEGGRVLDLFAGSGALGIEALSRGAQHAVFCDNSREAARVIHENLGLLRLTDQSTVLQMDWKLALMRLTTQTERFDLVLLDPPYVMDAGIILKEVSFADILSKQGIILLEQAANTQFECCAGLETIKSKRYGDTAVYLFTREEASVESDLPGQL